MINELKPIDGRKSFYCKAFIKNVNGVETIYCYGTKILSRRNGNITRYYDGYTATTGRHIKAFCGLNKKEFLSVPLA